MRLFACESVGMGKQVNERTNEWESACVRACMCACVHARARVCVGGEGVLVGTHNWHSSFHTGFKVSSLTEVLQSSVLLAVKYTVQNGLLRPA